MTVAVMCECSGTIRDALIARGIDAVSIDLKPTRKPGPHIQGDALDHLHRRWAMVIAHPVCRVLTNAGAKHLYIGGRKENGREPQRWADLQKAAAFFNAFTKANARCIAIENPVPHCRRLRPLTDLHRQSLERKITSDGHLSIGCRPDLTGKKSAASRFRALLVRLQINGGLTHDPFHSEAPTGQARG